MVEAADVGGFGGLGAVVKAADDGVLGIVVQAADVGALARAGA